MTRIAHPAFCRALANLGAPDTARWHWYEGGRRYPAYTAAALMCLLPEAAEQPDPDTAALMLIEILVASVHVESAQGINP